MPQKQCPDCNLENHTRTRVCTCGHEFYTITDKFTHTAAELQAAVNMVESAGNYTAQTQVYIDVAKLLGVKTSTLKTKIKEFGITLATTKGVIGVKGVKAVSNKQSIAVRYAKTFAEMRREFPAEYHHFIDKAEKGSKRAAIACKCIDCMCFQREEVRLCTSFGCSNFPHRPFKTNEEKV